MDSFSVKKVSIEKPRPQCQNVIVNQINYEFIEKYQKIFEQDPQSKVFAPLGEAYRKMGLLDEALQVLKKGVRFHPHFASGRVALAKVQIELKTFEEAIENLQRACELSPENILAHRLLAECYVHLKKPKEALKSFKMVLFLNPNDAQAQSHVKKLESLTADEYEDELFEMKPLKVEIAPSRARSDAIPQVQEPINTATRKERQLERMLSLTDAFIARLDLDRALETLEQAENTIGSHPEISKRLKFLSARISGQEPEIKNTSDPSQRIDFLKGLLQKIESRRQY